MKVDLLRGVLILGLCAIIRTGHNAQEKFPSHHWIMQDNDPKHTSIFLLITLDNNLAYMYVHVGVDGSLLRTVELIGGILQQNHPDKKPVA